MTKILIPTSQFVSGVLPFYKNTSVFLLAALNLLKSFNINDLPFPCTAEVVFHLRKAGANVKYFLASPINPTMLSVSGSIALCSFVVLNFIIISPIILFQNITNIMRKSVSAPISSKLPPHCTKR